MRISDWSSDVCSSDLSRGGIISSCIIGAAALALVARVLVLQRGGIVVEHQALLASQRDEATALGAADQREARLLRQRDAPGGEAGARYQDGNANLHRLDNHLRGKPPGDRTAVV